MSLSEQELFYYLWEAEVGEDIQCRSCLEWFEKPAQHRRVCDACYEGWLLRYNVRPLGWKFGHSVNQAA